MKSIRVLVVLWIVMIAAVHRSAAVECARLEVSSLPASSTIFVGGFEGGEVEPWGHGQVFSAREVLDVVVTVGLDQVVTGVPVLGLELTTPNGHCYQKIAVPISSEAARSGTSRKISDYPLPVPIQVTQSRELDAVLSETVSVSVPVAGTSIVSNAVYGVWSVEATLDGQRLACPGEGSFVILP